MFLLRRGDWQSSVRRGGGYDLLRVCALEEEVFDQKYVPAFALVSPIMLIESCNQDLFPATEKPKVPKPRPVIKISSAKVGTSVGTSAAVEEEIVVVDKPTQGLLVGNDKGVRKVKSSSSVGSKSVEVAAYADHDTGKIAMRELEVRLKDWSLAGWKIGEDIRELRGLLYGPGA